MKRTIVMILMPLLMLLPAAAFMEPVYAACGNDAAAQQVANGIDETNNAANADTSCGAGGINTAIGTAVQILSLIVGAAAIIAIISSGFKYITSGGDASKVANAKSTLIYALIGIALAVLAQLIVRVVISQTNIAVSPCPSNAAISNTDARCH